MEKATLRIQLSRIVPRGNPTKSDDEYVLSLSMTDERVWKKQDVQSMNQDNQASYAVAKRNGEEMAYKIRRKL
jgi:hypothetical protein